MQRQIGAPTARSILILRIAAIVVGGTTLFCAACGGNTSSADVTPGVSQKPLNVVATTVQITALTKEVGGDKISLTGMIPAGADPHAFEPRPSDLAKIENAQLILRFGLDLDSWLDDTLHAGAEATVVTVTEGVALRQAEEDGDQVDDPHVWHDPDNDKVIVDNITKALDDADPENKQAYGANAAAYKRKLDETKSRVRMLIDSIPPDSRKLVTDHDAFGYFAHAFGLTIVGAVFPTTSTEGEPSAGGITELLDTIESQHVKAVFAERSVNARVAKQLAEDAHVTIVDHLYGDSLGDPGSGADSLDGMLLYNARKIADALKQE